jgi:hypothetical protein
MRILAFLSPQTSTHIASNWPVWRSASNAQSEFREKPWWRIDDDEVVPRIPLLRGHDQEAYDVLLLERSPVTVGAQAVQRVVDSSGG